MNDIKDILQNKKTIKPPAYQWQDLALKIIKELNIPDFKKSSAFKLCKEKSQIEITRALNDTKELHQNGEKWRYFFKILSSKK